ERSRDCRAEGKPRRDDRRCQDRGATAATAGVAVKLRWRWDRDPAEPPQARAPEPASDPLENELLGVGPVELGERAETLLRDPLLRAAFAKIRRDIESRWVQTRAHERDEREACHAMIVALANVEAELKRYVGNRKIIQERRRQEAA